MTHARFAATLFFVVGPFLAGCGGSTQPAAPPVVAPMVATTAKEIDRGARWVLFLDAQPVVHAHAPVDSGGALLAIGNGERWLIEPNGALRNADLLLPEPIFGLLPASSGWGFLGATGTVYRAAGALSPVVEHRAPKTPALAAAAGKRRLFVVSSDRVVRRSDDLGVTWSDAPLPKLGAQVPHAVSANARGDVVVLAYPEAWFVSQDDGATFSTKDWQLGAQGLASSATGRITIATPEGTFGAPLDPYGAPTPISDAFPRRPIDEAFTTLTRRVLTGDGWVGFKKLLGHRWEKGRAAFGEVPVFREEPLLEGCRDVRAAAWGTRVVVTCEPVDAKRAHLLESNDSGASFTKAGELPFMVRDLAAGPRGFTLVEGACPPGCSAWVRAAGKDGDAEGPKLHDLRSAFHPEHGGYSIGKASDHAYGLVHWSLGDAVAEPRATFGKDTQPLSIAVLDDGRVVLALANDNVVRIVTSSDGGATFTERAKLEGVHRIDLAGAKGLAVGPIARETLDGGATWTPVPSPAPIGWLRCGALGCLTDRGFRVGWGEPKGIEPTAPPKVATERPRAKDVVCKPTGAWVSLGHVEPVKPANVDLGPTVRSMLPVRSAKDAVSVRIEKLQGTQTVSLLPPVADDPTRGNKTVVRVQTLGVLAYRWSYARKKGLGLLNPVDVSLAWVRADGVVHKATRKAIAAFRVDRDDPERPVADFDEAERAPSISWLTRKGVYLRPPIDEEPILFFSDDGKQNQELPPLRTGAFGPFAPIDVDYRILGAHHEGPLHEGAEVFVAFDGTLLRQRRRLGKLWDEKDDLYAVWPHPGRFAFAESSEETSLFFDGEAPDVKSSFRVDLRSYSPVDGAQPVPSWTPRPFGKASCATPLPNAVRLVSTDTVSFDQKVVVKDNDEGATELDVRWGVAWLGESSACDGAFVAMVLRPPSAPTDDAVVLDAREPSRSFYFRSEHGPRLRASKIRPLACALAP